MNSKLLQASFWIGTALCLTGIFLPWEIEGGPTRLITYGIQIFPRLDENGGLLLLIMVIVHIVNSLLAPPPPEKAGLGYLLSAALLVVSALFYTGRWFLHHLLYSGALSAPVMGIGLAMVLAGSVILLAVAMTKI